jgi:hypothetical protein
MSPHPSLCAPQIDDSHEIESDTFMLYCKIRPSAFTAFQANTASRDNARSASAAGAFTPLPAPGSTGCNHASAGQTPTLPPDGEAELKIRTNATQARSTDTHLHNPPLLSPPNPPGPGVGAMHPVVLQMQGGAPTPPTSAAAGPRPPPVPCMLPLAARATGPACCSQTQAHPRAQAAAACGSLPGQYPAAAWQQAPLPAPHRCCGGSRCKCFTQQRKIARGVERAAPRCAVRTATGAVH